MYFKDEILVELSKIYNIAQFISYDPNLNIRFGLLKNFSVNQEGGSYEREQLEILLKESAYQSLNIRSFKPDEAQSQEFIFGLTDIKKIESELGRLAGLGLYTIVHETIDLDDGGVSGVLCGDVIEFSPKETGRCVERIEGTPVCTLPANIGINILDTIYNIGNVLRSFHKEKRVEFSIHPKALGVNGDHYLVWEESNATETDFDVKIDWPNTFSQFIGDKVFGLLVANFVGMNVPLTVVHCKNTKIPVFHFGHSNNPLQWTRTAPRVPQHGVFTTLNELVDPYKLMQKEDTEDQLASCILQSGVDAVYSGACITTESGCILEGVNGCGDKFMLGQESCVPLPDYLVEIIEEEHKFLLNIFDKVKFEWAFDGNQLYILQLHNRSNDHSIPIYTVSSSNLESIDFYPKQGVDSLNELKILIEKPNIFVRVHGNIGVTSHIADILRENNVPSIFVRSL